MAIVKCLFILDEWVFYFQGYYIAIFFLKKEIFILCNISEGFFFSLFFFHKKGISMLINSINIMFLL